MAAGSWLRIAARRCRLQVLAYGQIMEGAIGLKSEADTQAHPTKRGQRADVAPVEQNAALIRPVDAAQQCEQGRLAGPVRPYDAVQLAGGHIETDMVGRNHATKPLSQCFRGEGRARCHGQRPAQAAAMVARQP